MAPTVFHGGFVGQILALLKARKASRTAFVQRLDRTVNRIEELTDEVQRRLELLDFIEGFVYHARNPSEHPLLHQRINEALRYTEDRLEVEMARRMMSDIHREEGRLEGVLADRKRTLLEGVPLRFGSLPPQIEQAIRMNQNADQLAEWVRRLMTAKDIADVGIVPPG